MAPADNSCPDEPCLAAPVRIEPGQILERSALMEFEFRRMPSECAENAPAGGVNCVAFIESAAGNYTLSVRAALELDCRDATGDCECRAGADGTCTNTNVYLSETPILGTAELVPTLEGVVVTIAAPE